MTVSYSAHLQFPIPDFLQSPWHTELIQALETIDRALYQMLVSQNVLSWANSTAYTIGTIARDTVLGSAWISLVAHTSGPTPLTFAEERATNPTFWAPLVYALRPRGAWTNSTSYAFYDLVFDAAAGVFAICTTAHVSSPDPATIIDDEANWQFLTRMNDLPASAIPYENSSSDLSAENVQDALDELDDLKAPIANPTFTGEVNVPEPTTEDDNSTKAATTSFVQAVGLSIYESVVAGAPVALNTLLKLAEAIGLDASFSDTITASIALKANITSPTFLGEPLAPTPPVDDNTTKVATAEFVTRAIAAIPPIQPPSMIIPFAGLIIPSGYLDCDGGQVNRSNQAALFAALVKNSLVTITLASPAVVTWTGHGLTNNMPVLFITTGTLPSGLVASTTYYVDKIDNTKFRLLTTPGGAAVNTTGPQSGSHTAWVAPYGLGNGSTTFNLPDLRNKVIRGFGQSASVGYGEAINTAGTGTLEGVPMFYIIKT